MRKLKSGISVFLCMAMIFMSGCKKDNNTTTDFNPFESQDDGLVETPTETFQQEMLELINAVRTRESDCGSGIVAPSTPLTWDSRLHEAALAHAISMHDKGYFSHDGDDGSDVAERVERAGYNWRYVGENIAFDSAEESVVVLRFEDSDVHCKVMNNANYKEVGIARSGDYWVLVFGTHM